MIRLHFVVEGQTEEEFVNSVLVQHLAAQEVIGDARCVLTSRQGPRQFKGGISKYVQVQRDLRLWMKEDQASDARFTTMIDLYGLPGDFPGKEQTRGLQDPYQRISQLENHFAQDISDRRFIPHVQLHEFEALLFSEIRLLELEFPSAIRQIAQLQDSVAHFKSPELIDEGTETAPSKRIIAQIPDYRGLKVSAGPRLAAAIGLPMIRAKCPHFNAWLVRLEGLQNN